MTHPADPTGQRVPDTVGSGWTRGRRLGLDVGTARIGVASCDPDGILATPVETIRVTDGDPGWAAELRRLATLVEEYDAVAVVVGLPTSLKGRETASTAMARSFVAALTAGTPELPVELVDERLTTVTAGTALHGAGRNTRKQRDVIDQAAAVVLLQAWLDSRHARR
ncbi:Holliday junction resolvase RuvX [Dietzia sp. ANT_WB102]|uniref:Holliday junction resolvase RuvX n=1 Tax=Dietzia sp. ANT_WB102 TaxID=2597345 RepID=UPI0011EBEBAE|nr:Holliday junction resolvase RuvX [Dietzia sp. ANT_WB102]KAA0919635.1 Holliday junction resolvase RuvX [Dietzia sp. ANT_WB102]